MDNYKSLLLIVSPEMQHTPAWLRATELARKTGARLHLCLVDYKPAIANLRHIDDSVMRLAADNYMGIRLRWLESEAASLARQGIKADCSAVWGKAACEIIVAAALEKKPDLVIKDVVETGPVQRTIFTPLDWQLLRMCPTPLLLVNPQAGLQPKRIIAAIDPMEDGDTPNELNAHILRAALAMAIQCDAQLHAVYAYPRPDLPDEPVAGAQPTHYEKIRRDARAMHLKAFERLMDSHSVPAEQRHFLEGKETEIAISEFADRLDTDVVVLGTVYRGTVDRLMMGSTAERLLYRLDCDVLALKPGDFGKQLPKLLKDGTGEAINYLPGKQ
jgi:universal stress protein E